jgi:hypothetical protein
MASVLLLAQLLPCRAPAAGQAPSVVVDGRALPLSVAPLHRQGALLLPMRSLFEALGAQVQWLSRERKIDARRGDDRVELWVGTPVAQVNHLPVQLTTPPVLVAGQAYVPLRFVAEALGGQVRWDPGAQTVFVQSSQPSPAAGP